VSFIKIILLLPGTILHEFLHFIIGFVLNGKPTGFSLIPKRTKSGYILGSVSFKNITFYNAFPIAIAPVFSLIPAFYLFYLIQTQIDIQVKLLYCYLIWTFLKSSLPSTQDIKVMFMYPFGLALYLGVIYLVFFRLL
jgi:hypothetical protein